MYLQKQKHNYDMPHGHKRKSKKASSGQDWTNWAKNKVVLDHNPIYKIYTFMLNIYNFFYEYSMSEWTNNE
jgi:hypothetical protein